MLAKKIFLVIFLVILLFIPTLAQLPNSQSNSQSNQENEATIKINTELVSFDVQVLSKKTNTPLNSLTLDNFEVYENGVKQNLSSFSQDKLPLSVLVLLDVSGSVEGISAELKEATIRALNLLKPEDEVSLMAFATGTGALDGFTKDKQIVIDNIEQIRLKTIASGRTTAFNLAASDAINHIKKFASPNYRKVIITITDNIIVKPSSKEKQKVITSLLEAGITISGLLVKDTSKISPIISARLANRNSQPILRPALIPGPDTNPQNVQRGAGSPPISGVNGSPVSDNRTLTEERSSRIGSILDLEINGIDDYVLETGGEIVDARKNAIEEKFVELVEHLRARYSVGYVPSSQQNDGKLRKLKIKVVSNGKEIKDIAIKSKRGYFSPKEQVVQE
ncbi:MAG: VWA domain-containing protein [Acidobacteria bacterium]|nr:VWA domain-containing protein [Acidobacteriota bacterium]